MKAFFLFFLFAASLLQAQTYKVLVVKGALHEREDVFSQVIAAIPKGVEIKILSGPTNQGMYFVDYNGLLGYINERYFLKSVRRGNPSSPVSGSGTGFALSSDGYIVTNSHVTNGAGSIKIRGVNGDFSKRYNARVVVEDTNNDLAILKIDDPAFGTLGNIPYTILNKASDVGSSIFVLGYPLRATMGDEVKLTNGIISSKTGFQGNITTYQTSVPVQPGNSGGPVFDDKGNIVGIVCAKHTEAENASYAVKASYLMPLIDLMPSQPKLPTVNTISGKPLPEIVKVLNKFVYIIEIN